MSKEVAVVAEAPAGAITKISSERFAALAAQAKDAAAKERPSISKISLKSGVISFGGTPVKDNRLEMIILAATYRNTFYAGRYDPNNIVNPNCFSLSETDENMVPDPVVANPINATCEGCEYAEWGSDLNGGRGKACKETRRLVAIPASVFEAVNPVEAIKTAEMAILDVPVTSVRNYSQYVNVLASSVGLPVWACVTEISAKPDPKTQFKVEFKGVRGAPDDATLDALEARKADAVRIGLMGYDSVAEEGEEDATPAPAPAGKGKAKKF